MNLINVSGLVLAIFILLFFPFSVYASPSAQQTIWFNPETLECAIKPTFDEHGSIILVDPWVEGNQFSLFICRLFDINTIYHSQILILFISIIVFLTILISSILRKAGFRRLLIKELKYLSFAGVLFFLLGAFGNYLFIKSLTQESNLNINEDEFLRGEMIWLPINFMIATLFIFIFAFITFKFRQKTNEIK